MTGMRSALLAAVIAAATMLPLPTAAAEPPWLAYGANNLIVEFEADPAAVRALLPAGLEPVGSTVHLNMYAVPNALGVPAYDRSYVWVDVRDHDAWDGTKGRYVLVGWAEPEGFRAVAAGNLHWPADAGRTQLTRNGD